MRITVHARGGLSVYGSGFYDATANEAVVFAREGETKSVTIIYPSTVSAPTKAEGGITVGTITASGSKLTFTVSDLNDNGYADITASAGETRVVRIRAMTDAGGDRYV